MSNKQKVIVLTGITATAFMLCCAVSSASWFTSGNDITPQVSAATRNAYFDGGDGSETNPYGISYPNNLYNLSWLQYLGNFNRSVTSGTSLKTYYFTLKQDIDMSGYTAIPPIGTSQYPFIGHFEGNGNSIKNVTTTNEFSQFKYHPYIASASDLLANAKIIGFFGVIGTTGSETDSSEGSTGTLGDYTYSSAANSVSNVVLENATIDSVTSQTLVGVAAGYVNGTLSNVKVMKASGDTTGPNATIKTAEGAVALGHDAGSAFTSNLSDYAVVGQATTNYVSGVEEDIEKVFTPETSTDNYNPNGGGGEDTTITGDYISIKDIYNSLSAKQAESSADEANTLRYITWTSGTGLYTYNVITYSAEGYSDCHFSTTQVTTSVSDVDRTTAEYNFIIGGPEDTVCLTGAQTFKENAVVSAIGSLFQRSSGSGNMVVSNGLIVNSYNDANTYWCDVGDNIYTVDTNGKNIYININPSKYNNLSVDSKIRHTGWTKTDTDTTGVYHYSATYTNGSTTTTYYLIHWDLGTPNWGAVQSLDSFTIGGSWTKGHVCNEPEDSNTIIKRSSSTNVPGSSNGPISKGCVFHADSDNYVYLEGHPEKYLYTEDGSTLTMAERGTQTAGFFQRSLSGTNAAYNTTLSSGSNYHIDIDATSLLASGVGATDEGLASVTMSSDIKLVAASGSPVWGAVNLTMNPTYFPIVDADSSVPGIPADDNTGYITAGGNYKSSTGADGSITTYEGLGDLRIAKRSNASSALTSGISSAGKVTSARTIGVDGTDSEIGTSNSFYKYDDSKTNFETLLAKGGYDGNLYGLHFMPGKISSTKVADVDYFKVKNQSILTDAEVPQDSVDLYRKDGKSILSVFAGTYYSSTYSGDNNAFLSVNQILRDGSETNPNAVTKILHIKEVWSDGDLSHSYQYKYEDEQENISYSIPYIYSYTLEDGQSVLHKTDKGTTTAHVAGSSQTDKDSSYNDKIFDASQMGAHSSLTSNAVYYFEIPLDDGEFALGSVEDGVGAYLLYLDIGGELTTTLNNVKRTSVNEKITRASNSYQYPKGVAITNGTGKADPNDSVDVSVKEGFHGSLSLNRSSSDVTLTPSETSITSSSFEARYAPSSLPAKVREDTLTPVALAGGKVTTISRLTYLEYLPSNGTYRKLIKTEVSDGTTTSASISYYLYSDSRWVATTDKWTIYARNSSGSLVSLTEEQFLALDMPAFSGTTTILELYYDVTSGTVGADYLLEATADSQHVFTIGGYTITYSPSSSATVVHVTKNEDGYTFTINGTVIDSTHLDISAPVVTP